MRTQNELMVFVMIAGVVALTTLWTAWRWRTGGVEPDPAARVLALLGIAFLGGAVGVGPWTWIREQYGLGFWIPFGGAVVLFAADWTREQVVTRRRSGAGQPGDSGGASPAARARNP